MTDPELVRQAVTLSGLSVTKFAEDVMLRESRTVRRWLTGKSPIPKLARQYLEQYVAKKQGRFGKQSG